MRRLVVAAVALAVCVVAGGSMAEAAIVRLDFSGEVTELDDPDGILASLLPGYSFNIGDEVTGFYTIDTMAAPSTSGPAAEGGIYYHLDTVGEIEADIGANPVLVGLDLLATVQIADSLIVPGIPDPFDFWQYRQILVGAEPDSDYLFLCFMLYDTTDNRLSNEDFFLADSYTGWDVADIIIAHINEDVYVRTVLTARKMVPLSAVPVTSPAPRLVLHGAIPNPFNPQTTIAFDVPAQEAVRLHVYDVSGRLVRVLLNGETAHDGRNEVVWRGCDDSGRRVASGVYFYRLTAGPYTETKRMVLVK